MSAAGIPQCPMLNMEQNIVLVSGRKRSVTYVMIQPKLFSIFIVATFPFSEVGQQAYPLK